jgi:hypothetical protein
MNRYTVTFDRTKHRAPLHAAADVSAPDSNKALMDAVKLCGLPIGVYDTVIHLGDKSSCGRVLVLGDGSIRLGAFVAALVRP